jgi:hypothetical protein
VTSSGTDAGRSTDDVVYESARRLLALRDEKEGDAVAWVLGTEVARDTGLDRSQVLETLIELGNSRLRVKMASGGDEVEVLGIRGAADDGLLSE